MKIKAFSLLSSLDKYELNRLRKFIMSPVFNENQKVLDLFEILRNYIIEGKSLGNQQQLWGAIYPKQAYNDASFRRLCFDLNKVTQHFLAYESYQKLDLEPIFLLPILSARNLDGHFKSGLRYARKQQEKSSLRDSHYLYQQYQIEKAQDAFLNYTSMGRKTNIEPTNYYLDSFFLCEKLKEYCRVLNYNYVLNLNIEIGLIKMIYNQLPESEYMKEPAIAIYYQISKLLQDLEDRSHFDKLIELLELHVDNFSQKEISELYIYAQNYCIRRIHAGQQDFYRELFELYRSLLDKHILIDKGILPPRVYKNIVTLGLRLNEYDWIEEFIHNYNDYLPEDYRKNALSYNLASLYFHKKKHHKVIEMLREVEYTDEAYALGSRWLLLRTYYELDEDDALDSLLESFRIFIQRSKTTSQDKKRQYMRLIKFVRKLAQIPRNDTEAKANLKKQIEETKAIANREWLLKKLEER